VYNCMPYLIPSTIKEDISLLKTKGTYLFVGGHGGIGEVISMAVAKQYQASIILMGRTPRGKKITKQLQALRQHGCKAAYYQADIACSEEVEAAFTRIYKKFTAIDGIFHLAGTLSDKTFLKISHEDMIKGYAAKVTGSVNLYRMILKYGIQLYTMFSSENTIRANAGQMVYVAACSFQDAFAGAVASLHPEINIKCINWGFWSEVGMASSEGVKEHVSRSGLLPIDNIDGVNAFNRVMNCNIVHLFPIKLRPTLYSTYGMDNSDLFNSREFKTEKKRAASATDDCFDSMVDQQTPERAVELVLAELLKSQYGIALDEHNQHRSLSQLGIDSLAAIDFADHLANAFNIKLPASLIFDYPTIFQINQFILEQIKLEDTPGNTNTDPAVGLKGATLRNLLEAELEGH